MTTKIVPEVVRFNQSAQDEYDRIQERRREISTRLAQVKSEIEKVETARAEALIDGGEHKTHSDRLADLQALSSGLAGALDILCGRAESIKRHNTWLQN